MNILKTKAGLGFNHFLVSKMEQYIIEIAHKTHHFSGVDISAEY